METSPLETTSCVTASSQVQDAYWSDCVQNARPQIRHRGVSLIPDVLRLFFCSRDRARESSNDSSGCAFPLLRCAFKSDRRRTALRICVWLSLSSGHPSAPPLAPLINAG
jgi:hypothetical protein